MREVQLSGHVSKSVAVEYIAAAAAGNPMFDDVVVFGYDVEFVAVPLSAHGLPGERLARVVSCDQARSVVAVAIVGPADN